MSENTKNVDQVIELDGQIDSPTIPTSKSVSSLNLGMFRTMSNLQNISLESLKPQEWIAKRRETLKPWTEFMAFSRFKKPSAVGVAGSRVIKNIEHFQSNYLFVFIGLAIYCVITSPYLLFALFAFIGGCYILHLKNKDGKLRLFGKELSLAQLYSTAAICSVPVFLFAGATSAVFWIIGASLVVIVVHAAFYSRDEEDPFQSQVV